MTNRTLSVRGHTSGFWFSRATRLPLNAYRHDELLGQWDHVWRRMAYGPVFELYREIGEQLRQETGENK